MHKLYSAYFLTEMDIAYIKCAVVGDGLVNHFQTKIEFVLVQLSNECVRYSENKYSQVCLI